MSDSAARRLGVRIEEDRFKVSESTCGILRRGNESLLLRRRSTRMRLRLVFERKPKEGDRDWNASSLRFVRTNSDSGMGSSPSRYWSPNVSGFFAFLPSPD